MSGLPKGWVEATVSDVVTSDKNSLADGPYGSKLKSSHYARSGARVVRLGNIGRGFYLNSNEAFISMDYFQELRRHEVIEGDMVMAALGNPIGRCCVFPNHLLPAIVKADCFRIRLGGAIDPRFFLNWMNSEIAASLLSGEAHGVGRLRVNLSDLRKMFVPLPPLAEQKRIVAKLEALNAKSARARTELARIETLVSRYKQAVLSKAFSGELTREWRNGRANTRSWPQVLICDIAEVVTGSTPKTAEKDRFFGGDTPFFKPTELDQGYHVEIPRETLSAAGVAVSRLVPAQSVLITCIGATIGKVGFARVACCTNQQINALVPKIAAAYPEWLYWAVVSPEFQQLILENSSATTLPIINKGRFQQLPLALPPLEEQHEIVRRIEAAFARIDRLAEQTKRALELVGRLDEAILAKAFRGELVPQDENDEPAEHLLARIRTERQAAPKARRGRRATA